MNLTIINGTWNEVVKQPVTAEVRAELELQAAFKGQPVQLVEGQEFAAGRPGGRHPVAGGHGQEDAPPLSYVNGDLPDQRCASSGCHGKQAATKPTLNGLGVGFSFLLSVRRILVSAMF